MNKIVLVCLTLLFPALARAQWSPDLKLSTTETAARLNENMGTCILTSADTVHVIWTDAKDKDLAIYYKRSADQGQTWSPDTRLSPAASSDTNALLAQSGKTLHLVFLRHGGTPESASYYKRSTDSGLTWGPDVLLAKTKWWPGVAASGDNVYVSLNSIYPDDPKSSLVTLRRSADNGATWLPEQPISQAPRRTGGRAEDPCIMANDKYVHLVWNDNRDANPGKGMAVYYRRSSDFGQTFDPETPLTHAPAYTYFPTLSLSGNLADLAFGDRQTGHYDIFYLHSPDLGKTWQAPQQITNTPTDEFYPAILRDRSNIHLAWMSKEGLMVQHSPDAGKTWDPAACLTPKGNSPFLAVSGNTLHLLFSSQRDGHPAIYYKRNPTGNVSAPAKTP